MAGQSSPEIARDILVAFLSNEKAVLPVGNSPEQIAAELGKMFKKIFTAVEERG